MSSPDDAANGNGYTLRISRLTIDKLGVKLYDKVSAVVAELVANSYDADASEVIVKIPLGTELASNDSKTKTPVDKGFRIVVSDDGHGMTPDEARAHYLQVGRDRREHADQGERSRKRDRPVMGRKGIGKLAPFGICRHIEVLSSGGDSVDGKGFLTTHFFLDVDEIIKDTDEPVVLKAGDLDGTHQTSSGTTITLTSFSPKRVPDSATFHRQLAFRFALADSEFRIGLLNTRIEPPKASDVEKFKVPIHEATRVDLATEPVEVGDETLDVRGWLAMGTKPYKDEETAGVRIYARGKIVATTRDFEQPAGFTGEFTVRSYLVGEVHADWLDDDGGDDLIRTDRQSILWASERGEALREWGAKLIKRIAAASVGPRRKTKSDIFMEKAQIAERAAERYGGDETVVEMAVSLGKSIGAFAAEDELNDPDYVDDLAEVVLSVAPQQALVAAFKEISQQKDATIEELIGLFGKTRIAEMASYSQIADQRVRSVQKLKEVINKPDVQEADLQSLLASAPWLIRPDWSVLTDNQSLKVFRDQFVQWWLKRYGEDIDVAISHEKKRPDFTLVHHGRMLHVAELKVPNHEFSNEDYDRLQNYVTAFEEFFAENHDIVGAFPDGWRIDLIADGVSLTDRTKAIAFESFQNDMKVVRQTWNDFLHSAVTAHEEFLAAHDYAHADNGGTE